ncbi:MAG TPA: hypothetical protein VJA21_31415 [Verrucomicrobiae bacterium]
MARAQHCFASVGLPALASKARWNTSPTYNLALRTTQWAVIISLLCCGAAAQTTNATLPSFDFTNPVDTQAWLPTHDISSLQTTSTGLVVNVSGSDPYLTGPARDYPGSTLLWAKLRLYSNQAGTGQMFYFDTFATEANSARFAVPAAQWADVRVPLPALGQGYRIRIDPPGISGKAVLASLSFEIRSVFPEFDFRTIPDATSWSADHDIGGLTPMTNGLLIQITGGDPYMGGPARDYPPNTLLWLHLRLKSDQGGGAQVFYYTDYPTEANSVKFFVPPGVWHEAVVPMAALGPGWHLRIDPPGSGGTCLLERLWFTERALLQAPAWPKPTVPNIGSDALVLQSGELQLTHDLHALGAFQLNVAGQTMAVGHTQPMVGYLSGDAQRWLALGTSAANPVNVARSGSGLRVFAECPDADGARWALEQLFTPANGNAISVESRFTVNQDRSVVYLPLFTLLSGLGTFGTNKTQGLFCGLEYLENEPGSSEADIIGPESQRQVPDMLKVTLPLMALAAQQRYVGVIWEPGPDFCAVFDSPDRLFGSGGHIMGILLPGSNGQNRQEGNLLPYGPVLVRSNEPVVLRLTIVGGQAPTVVPALQQYVALRGLPPMPAPALPAADYFNLAARSWLDSQIRSNALFRHAAWPGFNPQPAADASVWMRWLAERISDSTLRTRLSNTASLALQQIALVQNYNSYQIGHVTYPLPALFYNTALPNAVTAQANAQGLLSIFQPDGTVLYQHAPGGTDYGRTHYAPDANGYTANYVLSLLENAAFAGDNALLTAGLRFLQAMDKFRNTVPRGAQTWEVPLHTPDILASAKLLRCYTLAYELTGNPDFLAQARYWAWTGIPFVYLSPPTDGAVGNYATIPVFGATAWVGSWFGVPVQWCGLVYADALNRFVKHDPGGPWRQIADGIGISGVQQSFPLDDPERLGLLPDSFLLRPQIRAGPPINPATVQAVALRFYGQPPVYDFHSFVWHGLRVFAPGQIGLISEDTNGIAFTVTNWSGAPVSVLVNGFTNQPQVRLNGQDTALVSPHQYQPGSGRLVLRVQGTVRVEIIAPARPRLEIKRSASSGGIDLLWPAPASNFVLEYSPDLAATNLWLASPAEVRQQDESFVATESAAETHKFFRLRQGP